MRMVPAVVLCTVVPPLLYAATFYQESLDLEAKQSRRNVMESCFLSEACFPRN